MVLTAAKPMLSPTDSGNRILSSEPGLTASHQEFNLVCPCVIHPFYPLRGQYPKPRIRHARSPRIANTRRPQIGSAKPYSMMPVSLVWPQLSRKV